jgi:DNA-binding winged helix-turn-helix (wHTH) protein/tetratricopeptide (TPR) repeat protein
MRSPNTCVTYNSGRRMPALGYRFGPFFVDRIRYRVVREGVPVELTPKLLDLLLFFLERAGSLVTKDELLNALWPDANVTENALAQAVSELRQALGDEAGSPTFIKTVARRGYRLIVPVEAVGAAATQQARHDMPLPATDLSAARDPDRPLIAVIDFTNLTGDADSAWLSTGIAETVTGDLHALGKFHVVDRRRVADAVRTTDGSLPQVAAALGIRFALVGSFQRSGGQIRVIARIVDIASGSAVADAKVDGELTSIFDIQDHVVRELAAGIGVTAAPTQTHSARDTASLEAYQAHMEGSVKLESLDVRQIPRAIAEFERAVAADPRYAMAHAGLASAALVSYETTRSDNNPARERLERALDHARTATALDDNLAEAHATLALVLVSASESGAALIAARRAVAIDPSNWRHWFRLGHASWGEARLKAAANTLRLYPDFAFGHFQVAMVHVARGELAAAETVLRQGAAVQDRQIARGGRYPALGLHWLLGMVRLALGDPEEALTELRREEELAEPHRLYGREYAMSARFGCGMAHWAAGRASQAIERLRAALELYPDHAPANLAIALIRRKARDRDDSEVAAARKALEILERTRPVEAGSVRAVLTALGGDGAKAAGGLSATLDAAPAGFAGWTWPIDPLLRQVIENGPLTSALGRLADRAR